MSVVVGELRVRGRGVLVSLHSPAFVLSGHVVLEIDIDSLENFEESGVGIFCGFANLFRLWCRCCW